MIGIVDYGAGNLTSVMRTLEYLGVPSRIISTGAGLRGLCEDETCRIIFPGVGHARAAMETLKEKQLDAALRDAFLMGTPILGICLGAQVVLSRSEEGDTPGLDLIPGTCIRFRLTDKLLKIPHMGWNDVVVTQPHPILKDVRPGDEFYFVHSYYPLPSDPSHVLACSEHGLTFPAAIGHRNLFATQFHPEKSGRMGVDLMRNFCEWDGTVEEVPCAE